jgi:arabinofuranosyltransferase
MASRFAAWIRRPKILAGVLLGVLMATLTYTAWLGDDCFFTLRTVDNFLQGYGPRFNLFERVQAYTHPLWMFVLSAVIGVTGEHYLTTLLTSLGISLAACVILAKSCAFPDTRIVVLSCLLLSRAFVDYSTSGLENTLSHFFFAWYLWLFVRQSASLRGLAARGETLRWTEPDRESRRSRANPAEFHHGLLMPQKTWSSERVRLLNLTLIASLAALTRQDTLLVYLPSLSMRSWQVTRLRAASAPSRLAAAGTVLGTLTLGFVPLLVWELFSFFYYGFPFPNTAYAKLGTGIPGKELLQQGLYYVLDSLRHDPITLPVTLIGCALPLWSRRCGLMAISSGVLLYSFYAVWIGGDFMGGRYFSLPFFAALGLIGQQSMAWSGRALAALAVVATLLSPCVHQASRILEERARTPSENGISDERMFYYSRTGLLRPGSRFAPESVHATGAAAVASKDLLSTWSGMKAFHASSQVIVLDRFALADPLLARLPARFTLGWRIGHFERFTPLGYEWTLRSGEDHLRDRNVAEFNERLRFVTSGPLFSWSRLRVALELNLGCHDHLIDREFYRYPFLRRVPLVAEGSSLWRYVEAGGTLPVEGIRLESAEVIRMETVAIDVDRGEIGRVTLIQDGEEVWWMDDPPPRSSRPRYLLEIGGVSASALWIVPHAPRSKRVDLALRNVVVKAAQEREGR